MKKLSNVSIEEFRAFLRLQRLVLSRSNGGHEMWTKAGMIRPIVFQTHINPLPEFVVKNNLAVIGVSKKEFLDTLESL